MSSTRRRAAPAWRDLLERDGPLVLLGAYDALSARLIERAGLDAFVIGGFPLVGSRHALPDVGLVGLGEMAAGVADILAAVRIPALIDGDHGYGDAKNVTRTVRTYEALGAGALLIEDQRAPKRCGHMAGKKVVAAAEMEARIRAAVAARDDPGFFLVARTDARAEHGLDEALRRAERCLAAGADGIFIEAPESVEELETIGRSFDVPQMCNVLLGGRTPVLGNRELHDMGFAMIVHGTTLVKRAARAVEQCIAEIAADRLAWDPERYASLDEFKQMVDFAYWQDVEDRFPGA